MAAAYRLDLAQVLFFSSDAKVRLDDLTQFCVVLHGWVIFDAARVRAEQTFGFHDRRVAHPFHQRVEAVLDVVVLPSHFPLPEVCSELIPMLGQFHRD